MLRRPVVQWVMSIPCVSSSSPSRVSRHSFSLRRCLGRHCRLVLETGGTRGRSLILLHLNDTGLRLIVFLWPKRVLYMCHFYVRMNDSNVRRTLTRFTFRLTQRYEWAPSAFRWMTLRNFENCGISKWQKSWRFYHNYTWSLPRVSRASWLGVSTYLTSAWTTMHLPIVNAFLSIR